MDYGLWSCLIYCEISDRGSSPMVGSTKIAMISSQKLLNYCHGGLRGYI